MNKSLPNGYIESIRKGSAGVSRFRGGVYYGSGDKRADIVRLKEEIDTADAVYVCLNYNEAYAPKQIAGQSICISGDVGDVLKHYAFC